MKISPELKEELKQHLSEEIKREKMKIVIVSTYVLSESEIQSILHTVPHGNYSSVENIVDASILGGIVIKYGSKIVDLSIKNQLQTFAKT